MEYRLNATPGIAGSSGVWSKLTGPGLVSFSPDSTSSNSKVTVTLPGDYQFVWTETNTSCQSSDKVDIQFNSKPVLTVGNDTTVCTGNSVQLKAAGSGLFTWTPGKTLNDSTIYNPVATPLRNTEYKVTLSDGVGCKSIDSILVSTASYPLAKAGDDQVLDYVFNSTLTADAPIEGDSGTWTLVEGSGLIEDPVALNTAVSKLSLGENIFLWSVSNGVCPPSLDFVTIVVNDFKIPSLITPNMDGINDYFVLRGLSTLGKTELTIFDRRGVKVFSNSNYDNRWDGVDLNGKRLPDDTYFYVIKTQNGKSISGYIVIR